MRLPEGLQWSENDKSLEDMHWASDIGALDLTKRLTQYFETLCVYAKYSY